MTTEQAKEILLLYRPGVDADDLQTSAALDLAKRNRELHTWLDGQLAAHEKIRRQFAAIPVSEALREQIISERPAPAKKSFSILRVAAVCALFVVGYFAVPTAIHRVQHLMEAREALRFPNYSAGMVMKGINSYGMSLTTGDLQQIRAYLAAHHRPADYTLPANLQKATPMGCVVENWQGRPVAMICFRSPGKPADQDSDLWFFVIQSNLLREPPQNPSPEFSVAAGVPVATWSANNETYLLAYQGDVGMLKTMLQ